MAASNPKVVPIAGGTDVMVELNMDLARPETLMDVSRLPELAEWRCVCSTPSAIVRYRDDFVPVSDGLAQSSGDLTTSEGVTSHTHR